MSDDEAVVGPYPGGDDDEGYPEAEDVVGPYPGGDDDEGYPEAEDVVGPYPGGDDDVEGYPEAEDVVGPYPGGDDDVEGYPEAEDVVGPYPGGEEVTGAYPTAPDPLPAPGPAAPPRAAAPAVPPSQPPALPRAPPPAAPPASGRFRPPDWSKPPVMHAPKLEAYENGRMARSMSLKGERAFVVGRNGAQADIVVADNSVSRAHCALINSSSATFVQDLDSAHGTWYDESGRTMHVPQLGQRLGAEPTKLVEGATLRFGTHSAIVFRVVGLEGAALPGSVSKWTPPAWAAPPGRKTHLEVRSNHVANPYLEHLAGGDVDETLALTTPTTVFGRAQHLVDITLTDGSISRQHAAIVHSSEGESFLFDLGSATGSFVNGVPVPPQKPATLKEGDAISLGTCPATYTFRVTREESEGARGKRKRL